VTPSEARRRQKLYQWARRRWGLKHPLANPAPWNQE
jgi:hypothetical protein